MRYVTLHVLQRLYAYPGAVTCLLKRFCCPGCGVWTERNLRHGQPRLCIDCAVAKMEDNDWQMHARAGQAWDTYIDGLRRFLKAVDNGEITGPSTRNDPGRRRRPPEPARVSAARGRGATDAVRAAARRVAGFQEAPDDRPA